jgi:N-acetylmuramoyl-L-alanine amidase
VDGAHTLAVTATTTDGRSSTATAPFQTKNTFVPGTMVVVDRPNAQSGPLSGPVSLYGWAITPSRTVDRVAVAIDGSSFGDAHYGDPRGDVCAVYSRVGCPNVGWDLLVDTTRFADGAHSLQLTAYLGGFTYTTTSSFTVANGGNAARPTKIYIDQPTPQATLLGTTMISGWALNNTAAISNVAIFVDGIQKGLATYGPSRGDVCAVLTGPNCPNVGWTFPLDTTLLANGTHVIEATASAIQSGQIQYGAASTVFTAANWTTNPTRIAIDSPSTRGAPAGGVVNAYGWAMDDYEAISSVGISIDGVSYGTASYGAGRGDVCAAVPGRQGCPNVGWNFLLDTTLLNDGAHVMGVTTTTARGRHSTVTSPFSVSNSAGNPVQVAIDAPASNATVAGAVHTYGWALEGTIGIASVQVLVDGLPYGTATYGDSRTDVCASYPDSGCNVGWDFSLDTTGLANGIHTFAVRALGTDGVKRTVSNSFQVSNNSNLAN